MLKAQVLARMQDQANQQWHADQPFAAADGLLHHLALEQHRANFDLWHEEDKARSPQAQDSVITEVKHAIDRLNQLRNDLVEQIDELLLAAAGNQNEAAPLHSETPGLIIDRLSILSLKIYHTAEEAQRLSASDAHHARNQARLEVLAVQRADLAGCLDALWQDVEGGRRRFKLYRQMKMYNDPDLNPVLYRGKKASGAGKDLAG